MDHDAEPLVEPVARGIAAGEFGQRRLQLAADNRAVGYALCQAKPDRADAGAEVEHPVARCGMDRRRQQYGIDRHAVALPRLQQADAPAQQGVFGRGGFHARGIA